MSKLKSIILTFENCDSMEILAKYIRGLHIKGISDSIEQLNYEDEEVETYKSAQDIYFIIKKSTKLRYNPFNFENEEVIFNRLAEFNDITYITLVCSDESRQTIAVPYEEGRGGDNKYQSCTYINGFDELIITIKKDDGEIDD